MKKLLSISLATVLCFGLSIPASAAAEDSLPAVNETEIVSTKDMFLLFISCFALQLHDS